MYKKSHKNCTNCLLQIDTFPIQKQSVIKSISFINNLIIYKVKTTNIRFFLKKENHPNLHFVVAPHHKTSQQYERWLIHNKIYTLPRRVCERNKIMVFSEIRTSEASFHWIVVQKCRIRPEIVGSINDRRCLPPSAKISFIFSTTHVVDINQAMQENLFTTCF